MSETFALTDSDSENDSQNQLLFHDGRGGDKTTDILELCLLCSSKQMFWWVMCTYVCT
jgi:hypothetical protein